MHIVGAGQEATKISYMRNGGKGSVFQFGKRYDMATTTPISNCSIIKLEIDGENKGSDYTTSTTTNMESTGVVAYSCENFLAEDLFIHDCNGYGVGLEGTGSPNRNNQVVNRCTIYRVTHDGVDMKGGMGTAIVSNCYINPNQTARITLSFKENRFGNYVGNVGSNGKTNTNWTNHK